MDAASMSYAIRYRPEIDGLRALAVIPVIFFHAGFKAFSGGFVGVDVFFVISGYLISSVIMRDLEAGTFSYFGFYERRARRILPALFFVSICCVPFALLWMTPADLKTFCNALFSVILSVSNLFFFSLGGYFGAPIELNPLLHTWSLAIEEQFYIVLPMVLLLLHRSRRNQITVFLVAGAIVSLVSSEYLSRLFPSINFYLTPSRAWELLSGAIVARSNFLAPRWGNQLLSIIGIVLIAWAIFNFDDMYRTPSLWTLIPVIGTCLVVVSANEGTITHFCLSYRPVVFLGLVSYSAYLIHQPLFAFARYRSIAPLSDVILWVLIVATFLLACISWRWVETPWRKPRTYPFLTNKFLIGLSGSLAGMVLVLLIYSQLTGGIVSRYSQQDLAILQGSNDIGNYRNLCLEAPSPDDLAARALCHLGVTNGKTDFVLFGDSFAGALADGVNAAAMISGKSGILFGLHSCPPIIAVGGTWLQTKSTCYNFQNSMLATVDMLKPRAVILSSAWGQLESQRLISDFSPTAKDGVEAFKAPLIAMIDAFNHRRIAVFIVCCTPHARWGVDIPMSLAKIDHFSTQMDIRTKLTDFQEENKTAFALFGSTEVKSRANLVDVTKDFCHNDFCDLVKDGKPLFFDGGHLSKFGSLSLAPTLSQIFDTIDKQTSPKQRFADWLTDGFCDLHSCL